MSQGEWRHVLGNFTVLPGGFAQMRQASQKNRGWREGVLKNWIWERDQGMNKTQAKAQIEGEADSSPEVVLKPNGPPPL